MDEALRSNQGARRHVNKNGEIRKKGTFSGHTKHSSTILFGGLYKSRNQYGGLVEALFSNFAIFIYMPAGTLIRP